MNTVLQASVSDLSKVMIDLPHGDRMFATSLVASFFKYGKLSPKQEPWVSKLIERAVKAPATSEPGEVLQNAAGIFALFSTAKEKLKYPKLTFSVPGIETVQFSVAGPGSKSPGALNMTDGEKYGQNVWFGRVSPSGEITWGGKAGESQKAALRELLAGFASDPAGAAAKYGKLSSSCCFCHSKLTTDKSLAVGYGPVCADNWGLVWG